MAAIFHKKKLKKHETPSCRTTKRNTAAFVRITERDNIHYHIKLRNHTIVSKIWILVIVRLFSHTKTL